jgi:hypothetical protein
MSNIHTKLLPCKCLDLLKGEEIPQLNISRATRKARLDQARTGIFWTTAFVKRINVVHAIPVVFVLGSARDTCSTCIPHRVGTQRCQLRLESSFDPPGQTWTIQIALFDLARIIVRTFPVKGIVIGVVRSGDWRKYPAVVVAPQSTVSPHADTMSRRLPPALLRKAYAPSKKELRDSFLLRQHDSHTTRALGALEFSSFGMPPLKLKTPIFQPLLVLDFLLSSFLFTFSLFLGPLSLQPFLAGFANKLSEKIIAGSIESDTFFHCNNVSSTRLRLKLLTEPLIAAPLIQAVMIIAVILSLLIADKTRSIILDALLYAVASFLLAVLLHQLFPSISDWFKSAHNAPFTRQAGGTEGERQPPRPAKIPGATRQAISLLRGSL